MNTLFSFRRFGHVLRWTLVYQMRQLLTLFAATVVVSIAVELPEFIQARNDIAYKVFFVREPTLLFINDALRQAANIGLLFGAMLLCVGASYAFWHLHRKNEGRRLLMLPATNLEKFVARWVVYVPVLFVLTVVAFMLGDLLRMAVWQMFSPDVTFPSAIPHFLKALKSLFTESTIAVCALWGVFLLFHSLSLFCSVWIGRFGYLFVTVAFFAYMFLFVLNTNSVNVTMCVVLAVLLTAGAYWLFCNFPKYKLFHFKD